MTNAQTSDAKKHKHSHLITYIIIATIIILTILIIMSLISRTPISTSPLNILIASDCPPFAFTKADSLQGFEPELINLLKDRLKQEIILTPINSNILLKTLYDSNYNLAIGAITPTIPRNDIFDFSPPYYDATQTVLSLTDTTLDSLSAISASKIGTVNQSSSLYFIEEKLIRTQLLPVNNLKKYPDLTTMINALQNEEIRYIIVENTIASLIETNYGLNIVYQTDQAEPFCLVLKKSASTNRAIISALSKVLASEQYNDLTAKYFLP